MKSTTSCPIGGGHSRPLVSDIGGQPGFTEGFSGETLVTGG